MGFTVFILSLLINLNPALFNHLCCLNLKFWLETLYSLSLLFESWFFSRHEERLSDFCTSILLIYLFFSILVVPFFIVRYITYSKEEEAARCIQSVHSFVLDGRSLR